MNEKHMYAFFSERNMDQHDILGILRFLPSPFRETVTFCVWVKQGLVNVPFWEYWTSPEKVAIIDHIPNSWVMFNGDI